MNTDMFNLEEDEDLKDESRFKKWWQKKGKRTLLLIAGFIVTFFLGLSLGLANYEEPEPELVIDSIDKQYASDLLSNDVRDAQLLSYQEKLSSMNNLLGLNASEDGEVKSEKELKGHDLITAYFKTTQVSYDNSIIVPFTKVLLGMNDKPTDESLADWRFKIKNFISSKSSEENQNDLLIGDNSLFKNVGGGSLVGLPTTTTESFKLDEKVLFSFLNVKVGEDLKNVVVKVVLDKDDKISSYEVVSVSSKADLKKIVK